MKLLRILPIVILLSCSVTVLGNTNPEDIPLSFSFFQSGQSSGIRDQLMIGYGDWTTLNATLEGLHMGIDLYPESDTDQVIVPFDSSQTLYSIGAYFTPDPDYTGCIIGIGPQGSDYGWAIEHLGPDIDDDASDWCANHARDSVFQCGTPIDTCSDYSLGSVPLHTHVQWSHWITDSSPGGAQIYNPWDALVNPFSFFTDSTELSGYDQVSFKAVWPEIYFLSDDPTNTGAFLLPDGVESYSDYVNTVGEENRHRFQDIVYGAVDIVVSPFSELTDYPDNSGCGVYSVGYEILRQNPLDPGDWQSTESVPGDWGYRELFKADGQIEEPSLWADIYEAVFHDISLFENAYIVTNSGADDPSSWQHGWANVWTIPSNDDWTDGICRGAWNTFLANPEISGDPGQNSEAFFPDGRYAVDVTAVSHASRDTVTMRLPVDDLSLASPTVEGVVVDNFIPSIEEIEVYTVYPLGYVAYLIYQETWGPDSTGPGRVRDSVGTGYLGAAAPDMLGIAVRYSEAMDPDSLGYFWFTGEWGGEERYSSQYDKSRWLMPVDDFRESTGIDSSGSDEYWQCYMTSNSCGFPVLGYIGRLSLHIGDPAVPLVAGDLAGNEMDHDPSTVASPRDPATGLFDYSSVEPAPYDTGTWGTPTYSRVGSGVFRGEYLGTGFKVTPGIDGWLVGECPYWCGFWLKRYRELTDQILVDIVKPDGSYFSFTLYEGGDSSGITMDSLSKNLESRYGWFIWEKYYYTPEIEPPDTIPVWTQHIYAAVIDSENNLMEPFNLGVGQSVPKWWDESGLVMIPSIAKVIAIHDDGSVYIERAYVFYPDILFIDTVTCELPSTLDRGSAVHDSMDEDSEETGQVLALVYSISPIRPNPCSGSAMISCSLAEPGQTEITVYDMAGHVVAMLADGVMDAGSHDIAWDLRSCSGMSVPSGLYFVRMTSGDFTGVSGLLVLRR